MNIFEKGKFDSFIKKVKTKQRILIRSYLLKAPKKRLKNNVSKLNPVQLETDSRVKLTIFCGKRDIFEGIASLYSFYFYSEKKYSLVWHEDGSLTDSEIGLLKLIFKGIKIIVRKDADSNVVPWLNGNSYGNMQRLRSTLIFGVRLIDINYFSSGSYVLQLDSDVLFINKPHVLLEHMAKAELGEDVSSLYNVDVKTSYCTSIENIVSVTHQQPLDKFNAGLTFFKAEKDNISYVEDMCKNGLRVDRHYYWEQTLFSMIMRRNNAKALPDDYDVLFRFSKVPGSKSRNVKSRHYVDAARPYFYSDFNDYLFKMYNRQRAR